MSFFHRRFYFRSDQPNFTTDFIIRNFEGKLPKIVIDQFYSKNKMNEIKRESLGLKKQASFQQQKTI